MTRAHIPEGVETDVLTRSARRCALCHGLNGNLLEVRGQIAHVDRDNTNAGFENLAFLCLPHHDAYDSRTSQSKGMTPGELKKYRDLLYAAVARGDHTRPSAGSGMPEGLRRIVNQLSVQSGWSEGVKRGHSAPPRPPGPLIFGGRYVI